VNSVPVPPGEEREIIPGDIVSFGGPTNVRAARLHASAPRLLPRARERARVRAGDARGRGHA
jgi:hypothetical protein